MLLNSLALPNIPFSYFYYVEEPVLFSIPSPRKNGPLAQDEDAEFI